MKSAPLSKSKIISEALLLLSEEGLEKVTLRKLAARLNVQAMSLYWHIKNKDELYSRMSDAIFLDCLNSIPKCSSWQAWLRAFGLELWRAQHQVRDAARLIFAAKHSSQTLIELSGDITGPLLEFGVSEQNALKMQSSVQAIVIGWAGIDQSFGKELEEIIAVEKTMEESLNALIVGWEHALPALQKDYEGEPGLLNPPS